MLLKKISFLLPVLFLLSSSLLFSQDQHFGFSAYSNFSVLNDQNQNWHPQGIEVTKSNYAMGYFSPAAYLYKPNGDYHEFEIAKFRFNTRSAEVYALDSLNRFSRLVGGTSVSEINVALRYSYSFLISLFKADSKFQVYLGAGASPYYKREWLTPKTSDLFPVSSDAFGAQLAAIPTITYSITDHWFLNLNVPITLADIYSRSTKTENPAVSISNRKSTTFDIDLLPNELLIRFGLGLKI